MVGLTLETMTAAARYCVGCLLEEHDPACSLREDGRPVDAGTAVCRCGHVLETHALEGFDASGVCWFAGLPGRPRSGCDCGEFRNRPGSWTGTHWAMLEVEVTGDPVPQGDLNASKGGRLYHANGKALGPWREEVADRVAAFVAGRPLLEGPIRARLEFRVRRPRAHYGTGRNAAALRSSAPRAVDCTGGGDLDKLTRAVLDALTGVAYVDDRQVVRLEAGRRWAAYPGDVRELPGVTIGLWASREL